MSKYIAPEVVSIIHYTVDTHTRAMVRLQVFTDNFERDEISIDYPIQGDVHMVALMRYSVSKLIVGHGTMTEMKAAIYNVIGRNSDLWKLSN